MAHSRFERLKRFEEPFKAQPDHWIVVRLDGRAFTR